MYLINIVILLCKLGLVAVSTSYSGQSGNSSSKVTTDDQCLLCWFSPHLSRHDVV